MPGCAAWGCSNRTEHGKRMFIFPADKARRKTWEAKVNRSNWVPSRSSYLCEVRMFIYFINKYTILLQIMSLM